MRGLRRAGLVVGWLVLGPLLAASLVVLGALLYLRTDAGHERVRRQVLASARAHVPGLDLGRVEGSFLRDLTLRDITVRDRDGRPAIHLDTVAVRFDLAALWHRTVMVRELRIADGRLLVRPEADGTLNINHLTAPAPAAPPPASRAAAPSAPSRWNVHLDRLTFSGLRLDVQPAAAAPTVVGALDLTARAALDDGRLNARVESLRLDTAAGQLTADGRAAVEGLGGPRPRLVDYQLVASASDVDPSALVATAPLGRVNLTVDASGAGIPPADGSTTSVDLQVAPSELAGVNVSSGRISAVVDETRWRITSGSLRGAGARLTLSGHGDGAQAVLDLAASLKGRLPGPPGRVPDVHAQGSVAVHVQGLLPDADVSVRGQVAALHAGTFRAARVALTADVRAPLSAPGGTLRLTAQGIRVSPTAPPVDRIALTASGDRHGLRVDAAAVGARVRGGLRARGTLVPGGADVTLQALSLDFATERYRQTVALRRPGQLRIRAGELISWNDVAVHGQGFRFTGDAATSGLYRLAPSRHEPLARLELALRQASFDGIAPIDAALTATLSRRRATAELTAAMPSARAQVQLSADLPVVGAASGAPRLAASGPLRVNLRSNEVHLEALPFVEQELRRQGVSGGVVTLNATVSGDAAHPDVTAAFDLRDVMYRNIRGVGRDSRLKTVPGLGGALTIETVPGAIHAGLQLRIRNSGVVTVDARTPLDVRRLMAGVDLRQAPVQATLSIPGFALASLADFTDDMKGVSGQLCARGQVTGTMARPTGTAEVWIDNGKVDELAFGQVRITGQASAGHVEASLNVQQLDGGTLTGAGTLDRAQGDRVQAKVQAHDLDLRFARLLVPTLRETAGVAQLTATASGSVTAPVVSADLTVERGRLGLIGQPTFRDVRVAATLRPGRATLSRLQARSGDGTITGTGWATLDGLRPRRAVFQANAHRFLVAAAGSTGARIDGELAVEAALRADVVAGTVTVPHAQVWLPKGPGTGGGRDLQKIGAHDDVVFVDPAALAAAEHQRTAAAAPATPLDIGVRTGPLFVRGKDLDIELDSTLALGTVPRGPHVGATTLSGGIHVRHGRINIQGQRFDFSRGEITFDGSSDINPRLDIVLERQYPDARVVVALRGTPRKPQLQLTSDPPVYDQAQIVSLVLTGQPGGQPSTGRAFDPTAAVATAVLSRLADKLAPEVGLDVLRVESVEARNQEGAATGDANTRVEVGKYISDRVYLSYAHVFGAPDTANQNEAHVEYRLTRRWMLETVFGDAGVGGVDALWTLRY